MLQPLITSFFQPIAAEGGAPIFREPSKQEIRSFYRKYETRKDQDRWKRKGLFLFMASNNFREYSVVIVAKIPHRGIGRVFDEGFEVAKAMVDNDSALIEIEVHQGFRRKGIGADLIHFINKCCPQFHVYAGIEANSRYRLTEEGAALIAFCENTDMLSTEQIIRSDVPESPYFRSR